MFKKFVSYYKPYKKLFFLDMLFAIVAVLCDLFYPMMTRKLVNDSIPNKNLRMITIFAGALLVIYIVKVACTYFMQYWGHVVGVRMQADMRRDLFKHLQKLPCDYFDNNKTGDIMSKMINDLMDVSELAHHGPEDLFISIVMIIGSFLILITINTPLTLIVFAFVPFVFIFAFVKRNKMKRAFMETRVKTGDINASLQNSISGIRVSKAFVSHNHELKKFQIGNRNFKVARERAYKAMAEYHSGLGFCTDLLDYVVLIVGGYFTYQGKINIGDFMAYILYVKMFTQPIKKLINFVEQYQNGMTGFKRYMEILSEETEKDKEDPMAFNNVKGKIDFKDVSFKYEDKDILSNLNIEIQAGKTLALVGPSGGGKTTLCNLIPRFYDVDSGDILIDNKSIYDISLEDLRSSIGLVQQEVFLFTGTIKENILYGNQKASDEDIITAAKRANIHEFIMSMSKGYDTFIGERGIKLSGGQKQRISIARVFLKNPPILILDEATSALDNTTEYMIQKSLEELCKGRTTIVVAHRLSTIKNADKILVLTDNGVEESGSHEELLTLNGIYSNLYNAQFINNVVS
ncbi:lipid A export ATP-binding/permease protein MsbA [Clostridium putrefaciens]|uniref:Lipid A export ATP-binding/permease protein MsbA n=1 Tax=Clostridium putrefaciens TaxID=99675 RepID=A0A381J9X4_9CLOT|nr:ABC transporter ATP-binding protein [Clostridium putrefaciens]SUY48011.1 lipid A export ATP-binding/permease protein MsbA [Clostridium putrefaciens]